MRPSLRSRLILGIFLTITALLVAAGATIYTVQRQQLYCVFDDSLLNTANSIALLVRDGPHGNWFDTEALKKLSAGSIREGAIYQIWSDRPIDVPPSRFEGFSEGDEFGPAAEPYGIPSWENEVEPDSERFHMLRPPPADGRGGDWETAEHGNLVIRSPLLEEVDLPRIRTTQGKPVFQATIMPDNSRGRVIGIHVSSITRNLVPRMLSAPANLDIAVAASTDEIENQLSFLSLLLTLTAVGTILISGGVIWFVTGRSMLPLETVAREIEAMDETGLKDRLADNGVPKEIEPVVFQFNELLGRLDEAFERERMLTADIAHELRTPVAEIRTIVEVTLKRIRDPQEYRNALLEVGDTIIALQGIIEKLLVLARLEAGQVKPELDAILLKPAIADQWKQVQVLAEQRGIELDDRCLPEAVVYSDARLLELVLSNVLSNAAEYALNDTSVVVELWHGGAKCVMTVVNSGCLLEKEKIQQVFERFWRADPARHKSRFNCGLGLTLVRRAMLAMGGEVEATVNEDNWFKLTLIFPPASYGNE